MEVAKLVYDNLDEALLAFAQSRLLADDDELRAEEIEQRKDQLRKLDGLHPGAWQGRKSRKKRH